MNKTKRKAKPRRTAYQCRECLTTVYEYKHNVLDKSAVCCKVCSCCSWMDKAVRDKYVERTKTPEIRSMAMKLRYYISMGNRAAEKLVADGLDSVGKETDRWMNQYQTLAWDIAGLLEIDEDEQEAEFNGEDKTYIVECLLGIVEL